MTKQQISANIAFLKYQIGICGITLIADTGLQKLITGCETAINAESPTLEQAKALVALDSLSYALKVLWLNNKTFCTQLKPMNSGDFEFGKPTTTNEDINYKDFEFELTSAALMVRNELREIQLPEHTVGNDIFFNNIEIQCKHPNVLKRRSVDNHLRNFQSILKNQNKFGVLGIGVEDCFGTGLTRFDSQEEFNEQQNIKRDQMEAELKTIFDDVLRFTDRVVGLYTTSTYYCLINNRFFLTRDSNAVLCSRPSNKKIDDETYKNAFKILQSFNPNPSWRVFERPSV